MEQALEKLHHRLRQLNNDMVRITEIRALYPNSLEELLPNLQALSEAIKDIHSKLDELEPEDSPLRAIRGTISR